MNTAWIGLGSNLGEPRHQIESAFAALARLPDTRLAARSRLYRSEPVGVPDAQPDYLNAVARVHTLLSPRELLAALLAIEAAHGRERSHRGAARTLDLDLLLYGALVVREAGLELPHPRLHTRAFVLAPLAELDPQLVVPGHGTVRALLARCAAQRAEPLAP